MLKKIKLLGFGFALASVFTGFGEVGTVNNQAINLHAEEVPEYQEIDPTVGSRWDPKAGTKYTKGEIILTNQRKVIDRSGKTITIRDYYIVQQDFTANGDPEWIHAGSLFRFEATYRVELIPLPPLSD
ncbi:MAG: hypothetical protein ACRCUP_05275 [Mycoplasmatales bacterium]